jgi:CHAT domain-containing protein
MVLMLTSESTYPAHVLLKNGDFLEQKAYAQYRWINIAQRGKDEISYRHFWLPIARQLHAICPTVHKAYISVDGVYHLISLESLRHPKTGKYLADKLDIRLVSNTKDLLAKKLSQKKQTHTARAGKAYLFGFPAYGKRGIDNDYAAFFGKAANNPNNGTMDLPGTHHEIKQIEALLTQQMDCRVFSGIEASETNLKKIRQPRLLHLATHGFFLTKQALHELHKSGQTHLGGIDLSLYSQNPMLRTGLLWANAQETLDGAYPANARDNGILTAHEVSNLALTNTELVVLSACDTGLGEIAIGQGVYGLQRAFLQAGAQALLMTLWEIDDAVTPWFMRYFYEAWLQHHNLRQAYRTAQKRLRKHHPSPYYWAAFVLIEQ